MSPFEYALVIAGICFYANSNIIQITPLWIFVRAFTTISMGMIAALIVQNLLKFYYPFFIEKRLKVLRYKPRVSPKTGKPTNCFPIFAGSLSRKPRISIEGSAFMHAFSTRNVSGLLAPIRIIFIVLQSFLLFRKQILHHRKKDRDDLVN